jgi:hypothetical protein
MRCGGSGVPSNVQIHWDRAIGPLGCLAPQRVSMRVQPSMLVSTNALTFYRVHCSSNTAQENTILEEAGPGIGIFKNGTGGRRVTVELRVYTVVLFTRIRIGCIGLKERLRISCNTNRVRA